MLADLAVAAARELAHTLAVVHWAEVAAAWELAWAAWRAWVTGLATPPQHLATAAATALLSLRSLAVAAVVVAAAAAAAVGWEEWAGWAVDILQPMCSATAALATIPVTV